MNNPFVISEINKTQSPLAELSKSFDTLPDRELNKSLGTKAMGMIPRNGGEWTENPGDSVWKPNREVVPNDRNYSNPEGKTWGEILDKYEVDGIPFHEGEPDFSEVSKGTVEIDDFSDVRYGAGANFDQADEKLAQKEDVQKRMFLNGVKKTITLGTNEVIVKRWTKYHVKSMGMFLTVVVYQK